MAQSLANVLVHIVYSTKHHESRELCPRHGIALDRRYTWD